MIVIANLERTQAYYWTKPIIYLSRSWLITWWGRWRIKPASVEIIRYLLWYDYFIPLISILENQNSAQVGRHYLMTLFENLVLFLVTIWFHQFEWLWFDWRRKWLPHRPFSHSVCVQFTEDNGMDFTWWLCGFEKEGYIAGQLEMVCRRGGVVVESLSSVKGGSSETGKWAIDVFPWVMPNLFTFSPLRWFPLSSWLTSFHIYISSSFIWLHVVNCSMAPESDAIMLVVRSSRKAIPF